jgi:hypothetical protein
VPEGEGVIDGETEGEGVTEPDAVADIDLEGENVALTVGSTLCEALVLGDVEASTD